MRADTGKWPRPQQDLLIFLASLGGAAVAVYAGLALALGLWLCWIIEATYFVLVAATVAWLRFGSGSLRAVVLVNVVLLLATVSGMTLAMGGIIRSGGFLVWVYICPMAGALFLERFWRWVVGALSVAVALLWIVLDPFLVPIDVLPAHLETPLFALNLVSCGVTFFGTVWYFQARLRRELETRAHLEEEVLRVQKLESLGTLAGGIAHDFNNILMASLGNLALARRLASRGLPVDERLERAERALERATSLTQQLLTFSRGGSPVRRCASIVNTVREAANLALHDSSIRGDIHLPDDLPPVDADLGQIAQLFQNLVINAVQAMPHGGTVGIRGDVITAYEQLLGLKLGYDYVRIAVRDTGAGIPEADRGRIFEPYFTTRARGHGLGLAICHTVVRNHGGTILVDSEIGKGSTFTVFLPVSDEPVTPFTPRPVMLQAPGRGRVLVMDDEAPVRDVLRAMLESLGFEVASTSDGSEAVACWREAKEQGRGFGAAILDLTVPGGIGGAQAAREILAFDPQARVLAASGYADDVVLAEHRRHGFAAVLRKPFSLSDLDRALGDVLPTPLPDSTPPPAGIARGRLPG